MTDGDASDAAQQLAAAEAARRAINARAAKEYTPYFGWGIFLLIIFPPFDFLDHDIWGPVAGTLAILLGLTTLGYFYRRTRGVRVADVYPWWIWPVWTAVSNGLLVGAFRMQDRIPVAATLAGVLAGVPLLAIGLSLRKRWSS